MGTTLSILCVIPARGGSKGIPRKNLREVGGRPLITWTIQQALAAEADLHVLVSTDDEEIADVARAAGADVPWLRPAELALDTAATEPTVLHAIDQVTAERGEPEAVLLLQATSPIRLPGTLDRAVTQFRQSGVDSLVGVIPRSPFFWWATDPPTADYDVEHRPRRQELRPEQLRYYENGSLYLTRTAIYREHHNRIGGRIGLFTLSEVEGIDIDSLADLHLADAYLSHPEWIHA